MMTCTKYNLWEDIQNTHIKKLLVNIIIDFIYVIYILFVAK